MNKNIKLLLENDTDISNYENVLQDCEKMDMICEQREKILNGCTKK